MGVRNVTVWCECRFPLGITVLLATYQEVSSLCPNVWKHIYSKICFFKLVLLHFFKVVYVTLDSRAITFKYIAVVRGFNKAGGFIGVKT